MNIDTDKILNNRLWSLVFFALGMVMVINQSVGFDFSSMPGGLGDGRFNNYILEHGYRYFNGDVNSYWNAPIFFPEKSIISYSDNLLGALPIYILCRGFVDRETAFQSWYLILIALNFWGTFFAMKKMDISSYASSVGAFIYAYSALIYIQTSHIQLAPRFLIPLCIVFFYFWLKNKNQKYFYFTIFLLAGQFYCGIYLGYFLMYVLVAMLCIHLLLNRELRSFFMLFETKAILIKTLILCVSFFVIMIVLFYPYLIRSLDGSAFTPVEEINSYIPRIWCYFLVNDRSIVWGWLNPVINNIFHPDAYIAGEYYLFLGLFSYIFVVLAVIKYRKDAIIRYFLCVLLLISIVMLSIFNVSLYTYLIYIIPGAKAIRAVSRFVVVALFLWSLITALSLDRMLLSTHKFRLLLIVLIPALLILDNIYSGKDKGHLKKDFQSRCTSIQRLYENQKGKKINPKAFSFQFTLKDQDRSKPQKEMVYYHIDAIMASQIIGLPCVNGYSAKAPTGYMPYFLYTNNEELNKWLHVSNAKKDVTQTYTIDDILIIEQ